MPVYLVELPPFRLLVRDFTPSNVRVVKMGKFPGKSFLLLAGTAVRAFWAIQKEGPGSPFLGPWSQTSVAMALILIQFFLGDLGVDVFIG